MNRYLIINKNDSSIIETCDFYDLWKKFTAKTSDQLIIPESLWQDSSFKEQIADNKADMEVDRYSLYTLYGYLNKDFETSYSKSFIHSLESQLDAEYLTPATRTAFLCDTGKSIIVISRIKVFILKARKVKSAALKVINSKQSEEFQSTQRYKEDKAAPEPNTLYKFKIGFFYVGDLHTLNENNELWGKINGVDVHIATRQHDTQEIEVASYDELLHQYITLNSQRELDNK